MATTAVRNLEIPQGTDWSETFQILDELGNVLDLTLISTIKGEARRVANSTTTVAFTFTFAVNTTTDIITVSIARAITSVLTLGTDRNHPDSLFYYDYEITFTSNIRERIQQGTVIVYREITNI